MKTKSLFLAFVLLCVIFSLYSPSLQYGFIAYDDNELVMNNPGIKGIDLWRVFRLFDRHYITLYHPITMISYWIDYQIWGFVPFGFRFTNMLLHYLNSILILYLILKVHKNLGIAFFAAFIFAIHPVQIESVGWIAERKNILSVFFLLIAVIYYWKSRDPAESSKEQRRLIQSSVMFMFALLSKPSVVVFPLIIFALNYFFLGSQRIRKNFWFYLVITASAILTTASTIWSTETDPNVSHDYLGGSIKIKLFVMMTVFWRYVGLLLFPYQQNVLYTSVNYNSILNPIVLFSALGLGCFFAFLLFYRKKYASISFWLCWFLVLLLPVSHLVASFPSLMNDRYLYLPMIGFFTALFLALQKLSGGFLFDFSRFKSGCTSVGCALCMVIPFTVISVQRLPDWADTETLWRSAVRKSEKQPYYRIYYLLASTLIEKGRATEAIEWLKKANQLTPDVDSYAALGAAYRQTGDLQRAENFSKSAITLNPLKICAYNELGVVYKMTGRYQEAESIFKKALSIEPENMPILINYGNLLLSTQRTEEGFRIFEKALSLNPDNFIILQNLSMYYQSISNVEKANYYYRRYQRLKQSYRLTENGIQ